MSGTGDFEALNSRFRGADRKEVRLLEDHPKRALTAFAAVSLAPTLALLLVGTAGIRIEPGVHFAVVCATAIVAFQAAIGLSIVGYRRRDGRSVMIGTAFVVMASLLAVHGFATPGVLIGFNGLVAFAAGTTLPAGAILMSLSAHRIMRGRHAAGFVLILMAILVAAIATIGAVGIAIPDSLPAAPQADSASALALLAFGSLCLGALALRSIRTYLLTRRTSDAMVGVGVVWLGAALGAAATFGVTEFGWWLGHGFELAGIATVTFAVAVDLRRTAPSRALAGDLGAAELVLAEEEYLGPQVRGLLVRLAEKDGHTEQHSRRVAVRAAQIGEQLGFRPGALRDLAVGGLLHDIGKLSVSRAILRKPTRLTDEEFAEITRHPENGAELLAELGGFSVGVMGLVTDHHERLDGSGYPEGLRGAELSDGARVLGVCDVYDALVSARVYRPAWTQEKALQHLSDAAGSLFDERVVEALEAVLVRDQQTESVSRLRPHPAEARLRRSLRVPTR